MIHDQVEREGDEEAEDYNNDGYSNNDMNDNNNGRNPPFNPQNQRQSFAGHKEEQIINAMLDDDKQ